MPNGFTLDCWMNSGQDAQSDPNHTRTETPLVHQIDVMPENPETQKADDELGDYTRVKGGAEDKQKMEIEGKNNTSLDSGKGSCWTRFKKFCLQNKWLVLICCLVVFIFLAIVFLVLYVTACGKLAKISAPPSTASTPSTATPGVTTPMPVPTGVTTPSTGPSGVTTPTPCPTVVPIPGAIITGIVETSENYTAALKNDTSLACKKFKNKFIAAVINFYAQNYPEYLAYYEDTKVNEFERTRNQVTVHFEVYFSQLDNDSLVPDAHSVLLDQVNTHKLGPFVIITYSITKTEN